MPRGACVVERRGKRDTTFALKYVDAAGAQCWERLGRASERWTRRRAEAELRDRLVRVERRAWRKPTPLTFGEYAAAWLAGGERRRSWKPGSVKAYGYVVARLVETFGTMPLAAIRPRHVAAYVTAVSATHAPNTVSRDVSVLGDILGCALREELVDTNPARRAERPKRPRRRWRILTAHELRAVVRVYDELIAEEEDERERAYLLVHRAAFVTLTLTGLRCGELRALRWRDVDLIENVLRVADAKTEEGVRSVALSPLLAEELWQHRRRSVYQRDGERVFCDPETGGPYGIERHGVALRVALDRAGIPDNVRPFHDRRHTAITHDAASGSSEIAVMAKAGHRSMATTRTYLHLAGVVFRDEAERLERRLYGTVDADARSPSCYPVCYPPDTT